ncbi:hypothetical protein D9601_02325 [Sphingomonas sp. MA1305]|nr:hypothetical protein [Sphingomonas sp. MA1305]
MGATITMRDDPWDKPIPEAFEPSQWNANKLEEAKAERARLYGMSDAEAQRAADAEHREWVQARAAAEADHTARRQRYQDMLALVEQWQGAPEGIKEFGLEQLRTGMDFDCGRPFKFYQDEPPTDGAVWKAGKLDEVARDIQYHATEDAKERARTDSRNAWIAQLRRSLEPSHD